MTSANLRAFEIISRLLPLCKPLRDTASVLPWILSPHNDSKYHPTAMSPVPLPPCCDHSNSTSPLAPPENTQFESRERSATLVSPSLQGVRRSSLTSIADPAPYSLQRPYIRGLHRRSFWPPERGSRSYTPTTSTLAWSSSCSKWQETPEVPSPPLSTLECRRTRWHFRGSWWWPFYL